MRLLFACIFMLAGTLGAFAERREALVFGANKYRTLRQLENADSDAEAMRATLEKLGFNVTLEEDRDLKHMRRALADFGEGAKGADVALIFYSGHGIEIAGDNRLVPVDADASSLDALKASTLPLEEVRDVVASASKIGLIVLDACRDDPFGATAADGRGAAALKPEIVDKVRPGLGRIGRSENILFAFSAAPGQSASDGSGSNSPFTAALTKYLGTDGLEIRSVLTLVQQEVYDETRGRQLPYVESGLPQTFFASTTREQLPERERLLLAMADVTLDIRDEVEKIAASQDMPLAPLYGALVAADLTSLSSADREKKLTDAAQAFVNTRDELKRLSSSDPQVTELRAQAERSLSLGAFKEARQALAKAVAFDAQAGDALAGNLVKRRLSEAATHVSDAGVARAQLDYPSAIAAMETAAALHERIEGEDVPDAARGERDQLLADLGDLQKLTGNTAAALDAYQSMLKAAQLRKAKAPAEPDAERDVVVAQYKIGDVKMEQGNSAGALAAYESALAVAGPVAAGHPDDTDWQRLLELGQGTIGDVKMAQGDSAGALDAYQARLASAARLADSHSGDNGWQRDVVLAQTDIGDAKVAQGDLAGALAAHQDSLAIAERLAASDPGNAVWQRDVSICQQRVGDVMIAQGDSAGAFAAYQAVLAITGRLAASDPGNTTWQRDVAVVQQRIGDVKLEQGDLAGALVAHQADLAIVGRLAAIDPSNMVWQRDVALAQGRIGDVKMAQGDSIGALAAYQADLAIAEQVAASDPGNTSWQRGVALAQGKIGDVKMAQDDNPGALVAYQAGLAIAERLAASDPDNADRQHDVFSDQGRVGDVKTAQGDSAGALAAYQAKLVIAGRLVDSDPGNGDWRRELALAHFKLAKAGSDARSHFNAALEIVVDMQRRGVLRSADASIPQMLRDEIASLPSDK